MIRRNNIERTTKYFFMPGDSIMCKLPPIVEPELDGDITARVLRRQRAKGIDALQRPGGRLIQRRNAAGLFHAYAFRLPRARDLKINVNPARGIDVGIHFILQPVFRHFAAHSIHIPAEAAAEISVASGKAEPAFGSTRRERPIRPADRPALAKRNPVVFHFRNFFWRRLFLRGLLWTLLL